MGSEKKMTEMKIYPVAVITRYNYYSERPDRDNSLSVRPTEVRATSFDDAVKQLIRIWDGYGILTITIADNDSAKVKHYVRSDIDKILETGN